MTKNVVPEAVLPKITHFNCQTLKDLYVKSLVSVYHGKLIHLEGFYKDIKGNLSRQNHYWDAIVDQDSKVELTLRITEEIKVLLQHDSFYEFKGYINRKESFASSKVDIFFHVIEVIKKNVNKQIFEASEYSLIKERYDRGFFKIEEDISTKLQEDIKPKIIYITGENAIVQDDFFAQLKSKDFYTVIVKKVNLSSKTGIIELLKDVDRCDYLAFVRGGGNGLNVFNQEDLCRTILEKNIPFITAIGHVRNQTMLERLADKSYGTPSAFGIALQELVEQNELRRKEIRNIHETLEKKEIYFQDLMRKNTESFDLKIKSQHKNIKKLTIALVCLVLIIMLLIGLRF